MKYLSISARSCRRNFAPRFRQNQDIFEKPQKKKLRGLAASRENKKTSSRAKTQKPQSFLSISHGDTEARSFLSADNPLHLRLNHSQIFVAIRGFFFYLFKNLRGLAASRENKKRSSRSKTQNKIPRILY